MRPDHGKEGLKEGNFSTFQAILMFAATGAANAVFYAVIAGCVVLGYRYLWG